VPKSAKSAANSSDESSRDSNALDPILSGRLPDLAELPHNRLALVASAATARLGHVFPRWIRRNVDEDWGVNGPRAMLLVIVTKHGGLTMSQASRILDVTPRAITGLVDGLEAEGLLLRQVDEVDKRVVRILPTERAVEKANKLLPQHEARFAELFNIFSDDELRTFVKLLERLSIRIKDDLQLQDTFSQENSNDK
jgi:DNA-binding MarR family transcriptional regulator